MFKQLFSVPCSSDPVLRWITSGQKQLLARNWIKLKLSATVCHFIYQFTIFYEKLHPQNWGISKQAHIVNFVFWNVSGYNICTFSLVKVLELLMNASLFVLLYKELHSQWISAPLIMWNRRSIDQLNELIAKKLSNWHKYWLYLKSRLLVFWHVVKRENTK